MADPTTDIKETDLPSGMQGTIVDPWSWVPPEWQHPNIDAAGIDAMFEGAHPDEQIPVHPDHAAAIMALQPGVGIPSATLDAAASSPATPDPAPTVALPPTPGVVDGLGTPQALAAPQPLGAPDAITGAGGLPVSTLTGPVTTEPLPRDEPYGVPAIGPMPLDAQGQLVTTPKPARDENTLQPYTDAEIQKIAATDPQKALRILLDDRQNRTERQALLEQQQQAEERRAIQQDIADRQAAQAVVQKKQDANTAAINAWMAKKVDPNGYKNSRSGGRTFLDIIGAIAGGAAAGQVPGGNGVNHYVEWMQKDIDDNIKAQESNLEREGAGLRQKDSILAQEFARTGSMSDAKHVATMAMLGIGREAIKTEMQQYDPAGTRAVNLMQGYQQINAAMQQRQDAKNQLDFTNALAMAKQNNEILKLKMDERHQLEDEKTARANTAMTGWGHAITKQNNLAVQKQKDRELDIAQEKEANAKAAQQGEGTIGGVATGVDENGNVNYTNVDGSPAVLTQKDGKTPLVVPKEQQTKIATMMAAGDRVNDLSNKLAREIAEWGGQSNLRKSPHWQIMQGDYTALALALHGAKGIEGFRPGTTEILKELTSDVDPTSFLRDATAGIQNAKDNINADIDSTLRRQAKYTGPRYAPLDTSRVEKLAATPADKRLEGALADPFKVPDFDVVGEFNEERSMSGHNRALGKLETLGMSPTQVRLIDEMASDLKSKDPKVAERAASDLENVRTSSGSPGARAYAAQLVINNIGNSIPVPKDEGR